MEFEAHIEDGKMIIHTPKLWKDFLAKQGKYKLVLSVKRKTSKRTLKQNAALHTFFTLLADALNGAGYSVPYVLKFFRVELDWSLDSVKELLWRPTQKALIKKKSTTQLDKQTDINLIYEHLNRSLGEKLGIHVDFPHDEEAEKDKQYTSREHQTIYPKEEFKEPLL